MTDADALLSTIDGVVADLVRPFDAVAVAYSGGLDSSIVAALAKKRVRVRCYCACAPSSYDEANARSFASDDGLEISTIIITDQDIVELVQLAKEIHPGAGPVSASYTIPTLCVIKRASEVGILSGSVADELFAGYAKYESSDDLAGAMTIDLEKALSESKMLQSYSAKVHKEFLVPYASESVMEAASDIPVDGKIGPDGRKLILRECARRLGLSAADRPKKAAQYSSGVYRRMKLMARGEGRTVDEWFLKV